MKKIVPFNNVLTFNTDIREITAISLEPNINIESDLISGEFNITGEYKITDGQLEREKFSFELPFDIALSTDYDRNTLVVDIDDFRYEIVERNKLKVNIDLYFDGEPLPLPEERHEPSSAIDNEDTSTILETPDKEDSEKLPKLPKEEDQSEPTPVSKRIDLLEDMLSNKEENKDNEENNVNININNTNENVNVNTNENTNTNENIDIFNNFSEDENYVTYRVYRITETDTIDKILETYSITKEELAKYNDIESLKPGDKLLIPANNNSNDK